jgi:hypothetical protein
MLKFVSLGLSQNPNASVTPDGKFNLTTDGRKYLIAKFNDPTNPFASTRTRVISENGTIDPTTGEMITKWSVDPAMLRPFVGQTIEGNIVTASVEPYTVPNSKSTEPATTFTSVVFKHENVAQVFRSQKHPLANSTEIAVPVVETVAETAELAIGGTPTN